jgi:NADH-quinone oxidoreductase subunit L
VGRANAAMSELSAAFDTRVIDGAVNGVGSAARAGGRALREVQTGLVQDYLLVALTTVVLLLGIFLLWR